MGCLPALEYVAYIALAASPWMTIMIYWQLRRKR